MNEQPRPLTSVPNKAGASKAEVQISFWIDLEKYAEFYGEEVNGETEQEALADLGTALRHAFQAENGRMRSPWYRAIVGRAVPVGDTEGERA
jgi:hypothetical protein